MARKNNGKKKNKNKGKAGHGKERRRAPAAPRAAASNDPSAAQPKGKLPSFWEHLKQKERALHEEYPTVYSRYKNATNRFVEYMIRESPSEMGDGTRKKNISSLLSAADAMAATGHIMDRSILRDLKLAIRIRTRVADSVYGGGDAGHKHFLNVLIYCWSVLNSLPKASREDKDDSSAQGEANANRFAAFMEDDDDEEEENAEEMFPSSPVPRPSPPGSAPLSLDDLLKSDERNDSILFLLSLDEIMGGVATQFRTTVAKNIPYRRRNGISESAVVESLLEATAATNLAIQQVQKLEMDLMVQHEHLTTPYRLLATTVLPEITELLTATVREHGTRGGCTEKDVTSYLGDCLESYFRNPSDPLNRQEDIMRDFCSHWQLDLVGTAEFKQYFDTLQQYVISEVPIGKVQKEQVERSSPLRVSMGLPGSHSWIKMEGIGGDRAIHHTLCLLQKFRLIIYNTPDDKGVQAIPGFFGQAPWRPGRSRKIRDLDELLMSDILPYWTTMCRKGIVGITELPFESELSPLFVLMRKYVKEPEKPVSWSITFAVHAMLTAILEIDPEFSRQVAVNKSVFERFFKQIKFATIIATKNPESIGGSASVVGKTWWQNIVSVSFLENLGLPAFGDRAIFNPLCAGTIFTYLSYFGNLEAGCAMIDCHAQLRITLHLYHALLLNSIIKRGDIEMLDLIYDNFRNSKAIWAGRLPQKGEFVQWFWICFGNTLADARRMSNEAKQTIRETGNTNNDRDTPLKGTRKLVPIEASEISKSYRRICNRDFHDVVDKYHTPEQRVRSKGTDFYHLMVNTNDTLDAIEDEQSLLALNLVSCGALLEFFVNALGRILQWEPILEEGARSIGGSDQRQGFAYLFAQYVLGALDFADDPLDYEFMNVPLGRASSQFMTQYLGNVNPNNIMWFQHTQGDISTAEITSIESNHPSC